MLLDEEFKEFNQNPKNGVKSYLSKIKSFIKNHPYLLIIIVVVIIVLCVVLSKKDVKEEKIEEIPIFPLAENIKSEVMEIYNGIGYKDKGTFEDFCEYLSEQGSNLKEEQKVYLSYYWIKNNIKYDHEGRDNGTVVNDPEDIFYARKTVCWGYSRIFKKLLLAMNYAESKIKEIHGYSKGAGYSPFEDPIPSHAWNAVEINGKWCLIDTTWDAQKTSEYYLCTPPKCFVRDHLPISDDSLQFLKNPISLKTFHQKVRTTKGFCDYNMEIIEDKAIQKFCGRGEIIIKYNIDKENTKVFLNVSETKSEKHPEYFINKIENGFKIYILVNEVGESFLDFSLNNTYIGRIYFECDKGSGEYFVYPKMYDSYIKSDARLISPIQNFLKRRQSYTFEIKANDFQKLYLIAFYYDIYGEFVGRRFSMVKQGDTFIAKNFLIEKYYEEIYINDMENDLLLFYLE